MQVENDGNFVTVAGWTGQGTAPHSGVVTGVDPLKTRITPRSIAADADGRSVWFTDGPDSVQVLRFPASYDAGDACHQWWPGQTPMLTTANPTPAVRAAQGPIPMALWGFRKWPGAERHEFAYSLSVVSDEASFGTGAIVLWSASTYTSPTTGEDYKAYSATNIDVTIANAFGSVRTTL